MAEALTDMLSLDRLHDKGVVGDYLLHLVGQPLDNLRSSEPQRLTQTSHSLLLSVQGVSKRSYKPVVVSAEAHRSLQQTLSGLARNARELSTAVPLLDNQAEKFSITFNKTNDNEVVTRRNGTLQLLRNSERLVDVMELPTLVGTASKAQATSHSSALELYTHARRVSSLYAESPLVSSILGEADAAVRRMAAQLIETLQLPSLKLTTAVRIVGWLKRILPDIANGSTPDDVLPALFLICRLANLITTLGALHPLQRLADEEKLRQSRSQSWSGGQQTERYLKRFIEVFREHSFNIVSVSRSIRTSVAMTASPIDDPLTSLPSSLSTFPMYLVGMLLETLRIYFPIVKDQASRESILTQVLYCASSLGRLGADFGMLLGSVGVSDWVDIVKRHRLLAGRLESVIGDYRGQQLAKAQ